MSQHRRITASDAGVRLDHLLAQWLGLSRRQAIQLLERGLVRVNEQSVGRDAKGRHVLVDDRVDVESFDRPEEQRASAQPEMALDVVAEVDDDVEVEIDDKDLRVDTYRSSGAGGQHVNTTDSAVRITHIPTGIIVACQAERSQHKNRDKAMKMLTAKLYEWEQDQKRKEMEKYYGDKGEIAWGRQIRSYVMQPYTMVKDHRTEHQVGNVDAVLDGDLDEFIEAYLKKGRRHEPAGKDSEA